MKTLAKGIKITAIVLNGIFLAGLIFFLIRLGARPQGLSDWVGFVSMFAFPPVTGIAIALTFHKRCRILTCVLRIVAVIVNASFLVMLIYVTAIGNVHFDNLVILLVGLLGYGLPVVNIAALLLKGNNREA